MSSEHTDVAQVLVVGAGPVGLTAAHELIRRDIRVRVIDGADGPATTSRATGTHARTLEIYRQIGIVDDILPRGQKSRHFTMHHAGRKPVRLTADYTGLPTCFPFTLEVDQVITEEVLRARLAAAGVEVEWGVALERLVPRPERAEVGLRHADGTIEELEVPWLVGADGGHSTVRERLGFQLRGTTTQTWLFADAVTDVELPRDGLHWVRAGKGAVLLIPFPQPGKWRFVDTVDTGDADDPGQVATRLAGKISRALGRKVMLETPTWVSVLTIQQRMIERMRSGRCFVAGDAAHVHSPASGQGLNTGVQDACNLAWKLADVINGRAEDGLLDTYAAERVPVAEALLESTRTATGLIALRNLAAPVLLPVGLGLLDALEPVKRRIGRKVVAATSGLALEYERSPLTVADAARGGIRPGHRVACSAETERASAGWRAMLGELTDPRWTLLAFFGREGSDSAARKVLCHLDGEYGGAVSVRTVARGADDGPHPMPDPDQALHRSFAAGPGEFALVRPDGYLALVGRVSDEAGMDEALGRMYLLPKRYAGERSR